MTALTRYAKRLTDDFIRDLQEIDNRKRNMEPKCEMPKYKCHKEVWALKIKMVVLVATGYSYHFELHPEDTRYSKIIVTSEWNEKHGPAAGGYYVVYGDGYASFSTAKAFEAGYSLITE